MTARERVTIDVGAYQGVDLAPDLWGLFIEDLNDALDGGLNAECVRNGDFEFSAADRAGWGPLTAWSADDPDRVEVRTDAPIHPQQRPLRTGGRVGGTDQRGLGRRRRHRRQEFLLSFFTRAEDGSAATLTAAIGTGGGDLARAQVAVPPGGWRRCEARLAAVEDGRGELRIEMPPGLTVDLDHVSLRPTGQDGRPLTFRPDLLQA